MAPGTHSGNAGTYLGSLEAPPGHEVKDIWGRGLETRVLQLPPLPLLALCSFRGHWWGGHWGRARTLPSETAGLLQRAGSGWDPPGLLRGGGTSKYAVGARPA